MEIKNPGNFGPQFVVALAEECREPGQQIELGLSAERPRTSNRPDPGRAKILSRSLTVTSQRSRRRGRASKTFPRNSPDMWIRANGAFEPVVDRHIYDAAQAIIQNRSRRLSDEVILERLRGLYQASGRLSGLIIDEADDLSAPS